MVVAFQSCAAGIGDAIIDKGGTSGGAGMVVAILLLTGGIVSIVQRKSKSGIALIIIFGIAAIVGFSSNGIFKDLVIWSGWCAINAVLAIINLLVGKKGKEETEEKAE